MELVDLDDDAIIQRLQVDRGLDLWLAVREVGRRGLLAAAGYLVEILRNEDRDFPEQNLRTAAAGSLGKLGLDSILRYVSTDDLSNELFRVGFADALGETYDGRAVPHLVSLSSDESDEVVLFSSLGLAKTRAITELSSLLDDTSSTTRIGYFLDALAKIGGREVEEPYEKHMERLPQDMRLALRQAFGR